MDRNPIPTLFYGLLLLRSRFVAPESVRAALYGLFLFSLQSVCIRLQNATQRRIMALLRKEVQTWN